MADGIETVPTTELTDNTDYGYKTAQVTVDIDDAAATNKALEEILFSARGDAFGEQAKEIKLPGKKEELSTKLPKDISKEIAKEPPKETEHVDLTTNKGEEETPAVEPEKEEVVEEPKVTEEDLEESDPEGKKQETWNRYKRSHKENKRLKEQLAELENKVNQVPQHEAKVADLEKQIEELRQERESIEGELYLGRIEATREYKQSVSGPQQAILTAAEQLAKDTGLDIGQFKSALKSLDHKAVKAMVSELDLWEQQQAYTMLTDLRQVDQAEKYIRENSKAAYEAASRRQEEEYKTVTQKVLSEREKALSDMIPLVKTNMLSLFPEDVRKGVNLERIASEIKHIDNMPENLKMFGGLAAAVLPDLVKVHKSTLAELKEAKAQLTKLRSASPKATGGKPANADAPKGKTEEPKVSSGGDYHDWAADSMRRVEAILNGQG